ncbi:peptide chain release factor N(5)-glutamine methyltransferase [Brachyspira aalborgi]|uniref:peptide chain release factor N(5)-glutamine methyltransferase n=1 Tax=Brachyspira aalborgi TaxID=29522 RepID=A0A5C8E3N0_9SPIR|nr:peptide chain release factor N(5)-glutamine methyltransferase [Brachyspira aalborgi]TXJ32447.1 peptide chain release factor N(5)-glutamine methyltransferase [Brachyspira aalborgi]
MNINQALNYYSKKLIKITKDYKIAYIETQILISHSLNLSKTKLISNALIELNENEINKIETLINRRLNFEPIAYITNKKEFYGIDFYVNNSVLIPRVETEEIIDLIKEYINKEIDKKNKKFSIYDIGAGCGNISITLKKLFENADITAIEISEKAMQVIKKNCENILQNKNSINIINADALSFTSKNKFDIIVSNPPYVALKDKYNLQKDLDFEPETALYSGYDGMDFYRNFFNIIDRYLKYNGAFFFEIGFNQGKELINICESFNIKNAEIKKDLSGKDRFLICYNYIANKKLD